ncbi:MAG: cardiolipin synthase [Paracoccus sp. (in: a-proteobacteria)]|nr:cardiolipin synthase [Paracoccus sp. (in: a-proteobacteria)]
MQISLIAILHFVAALMVVLRVLTRPRIEPSVRLAWIMIVEALPLVGIIAYFLFGEVRIAQAERQRAADVRARLSGMWTPSPQALGDPPEWMQPVTATAHAVGGMVPVEGNVIHLGPEGDDAFDDMIAAIAQAQAHIHILFYIWLDDTTGRRLAGAIASAAARGVRCRVVVDAVGSRRFTRSKAWAGMRDAGAEMVTAMPTGFPLLGALSRRLDLRNHRKVVVIDNRIGFSGSRNAADMAFAVKRRYAPWVDVWFSFEGPVVRQMQSVFLADWMSYTGDDLGRKLLDTMPPAATPGATAQVVATGPDMRAGSISDCIIAILAAARHKAVITTPYYVPNAALDSAMQACARRGVEVTLILPERNDSLLVGATSEGFYQGLLRAGVRLMLFRPGLLHAKLATVDGRIAMLGSGNLDRRSFDLNYEMNILLFDKAATAEIDARQKSYLERSRVLTLAEVDGWPRWRRIRNNTLALATPLL